MALGPLDGSPFEGTWELDPDSLSYQHGKPGRQATYVIAALPGGGMMFHLAGEDTEGRPIKASYGGSLDGFRQELSGRLGFLILRWEGPRRIDSLLERDGRIVDHWSRELLPGDAAIRFTHTDRTQTGGPFET